MTPPKLRNIAVSQSWDRIEDWYLEERCGMADSDTFFSDQKYLFLHNIYRRPTYTREHDIVCREARHFQIVLLRP